MTIVYGLKLPIRARIVVLLFSRLLISFEIEIVILENFLSFFLHCDYGSACIRPWYIASLANFYLLTLDHILGRLEIHRWVFSLAEVWMGIECTADSSWFCVNFQLSHIRRLLFPLKHNRTFINLSTRVLINSLVEFFESSSVIVLAWTLNIIASRVTRFEFDWGRWSTNDIFSLKVIFITTRIGHDYALKSSFVDDILIFLPRLNHFLLIKSICRYLTTCADRVSLGYSAALFGSDSVLYLLYIVS